MKDSSISFEKLKNILKFFCWFFFFFLRKGKKICFLQSIELFVQKKEILYLLLFNEQRTFTYNQKIEKKISKVRKNSKNIWYLKWMI